MMMMIIIIIITIRAGPTAAPSLEQPLRLRLCLCPPPWSLANIDLIPMMTMMMILLMMVPGKH